MEARVFGDAGLEDPERGPAGRGDLQHTGGTDGRKVEPHSANDS